MTVISPATLLGDPKPSTSLESPRAPGVHPSDEGSRHVVSPELWSLCAPGVSLPGCQERERLALHLLLRAIQTLDTGVLAVADLRARHVTSAYSVLLRLSLSNDLLSSVKNAATALMDSFTGHDESPYPETAA